MTNVFYDFGKAAIPIRARRILDLEEFVRQRTPQYFNPNNTRCDEKLLKGHILLAKLYAKSDVLKSRVHFKEAEREFFNICRGKIKQEKQYLLLEKLIGAEEKLAKQERNRKQELEDYRNSLVEIAKKIGYDPTEVLLYSTSTNPNTESIDERLE